MLLAWVFEGQAEKRKMSVWVDKIRLEAVQLNQLKHLEQHIDDQRSIYAAADRLGQVLRKHSSTVIGKATQELSSWWRAFESTVQSVDGHTQADHVCHEPPPCEEVAGLEVACSTMLCDALSALERLMSEHSELTPDDVQTARDELLSAYKNLETDALDNVRIHGKTMFLEWTAQLNKVRSCGFGITV